MHGKEQATASQRLIFRKVVSEIAMGKTLGRIILLVPVVLVQIAIFLGAIAFLGDYASIFAAVVEVLGVAFAIGIATRPNVDNYLVLWLLVILAIPVFGALLYLLLGNRRGTLPLKRALSKNQTAMPPVDVAKASWACEEIAKRDQRMSQTFRYLEKASSYPALPNQGARYYPLGDDAFPHMIEALEGAERYIFAEYFIVQAGKMFDAMVDVMERKAADGVDVRLMYDDMGSFGTFSSRERHALRARGIKCIRFNRVIAASGVVNYRDHRKILVVDGNIAFSGGINLADEYINEKERFGHWKDDVFSIEGPPALMYTRMFVEFWNAFSADPIPLDTLETPPLDEGTANSDGYVLSYYHKPFSPTSISSELYVDQLSQAVDYAWFFTPYLLLGDSLFEAFVNAAKRGIDVRIILPGVPDKKLVYRMSRSYYETLLAAGVKIYEYSPGFVHSKAALVDDKVCALGTVNLDCRSMFFHFENNSVFYESSILANLKADFAATQGSCRPRTLDDIGSGPLKRLADGIFRLMAPIC